MNKHILLSGLLISVLTLLFSQCKKKNDDSYRFDFQFITENYKPLNYTENSILTGLAPDILKEVCDRLNIPFEVKVLPWDQGYDLAQKTENAVLFSTILTEGRKDLFKWAGPIASLDWLFYATSQNPITLNFLEDAKTVGKIGVIKDYSIEQFLVSKGFTNLVYCTDNIEAFDKLLKGEIDLFPSDKITAEAALAALNKSIYNVTPKLTIRTDLVYFAFNKQVPDDVVADFQAEIDRLKTNGTLLTLYRKYLNSSDFPGTLQIYTEQYPPLTFRNGTGEITGFGTDIVSEIMKRNHVYADIQLSSWSNGYELALNNPNFCLFTMDRTDIRESLFQWVGPIGTNTTYFYTKAGSGIVITSLEDARNLSSIGTVSSWFSDQYLRQQGFTNLVSDPDPTILTKKLMDGEIDAFVCSAVTFPDILKGLGYLYSQVDPAFPLMSSDFYVAFSKNTPSTTVNQWQTAFQSMKTDGTYDAIYQKWFP
ncbi:MAG: transporter substrate-binding domain-containing protein [Bacteroidetes bacterium]|nr:transporter substrate-binding domain-containing protein [Bacteroidota bacterium]